MFPMWVIFLVSGCRPISSEVDTEVNSQRVLTSEAVVRRYQIVVSWMTVDIRQRREWRQSRDQMVEVEDVGLLHCEDNLVCHLDRGEKTRRTGG